MQTETLLQGSGKDVKRGVKKGQRIVQTALNESRKLSMVEINEQKVE